MDNEQYDRLPGWTPPVNGMQNLKDYFETNPKSLRNQYQSELDMLLEEKLRRLMKQRGLSLEDQYSLMQAYRTNKLDKTLQPDAEAIKRRPYLNQGPM